MVIKLIKKEVVLCMHPTVPIMLILSAMVMIPNYPTTVIFFYTALSIFFTCLQGRENNDILFSINLPIAKKDIVKARFLFTILVQVVCIVLIVPFILLRNAVQEGKNLAGMDANLSLLAAGLLLFGIFNTVFFIRYYSNVAKVGSSFLIASTVMFLGIGVVEASTYAIPFVKNTLDTTGTAHLGAQAVSLLVGIVIYAALNYFAYRKSIQKFERQDV